MFRRNAGRIVLLWVAVIVVAGCGGTPSTPAPVSTSTSVPPPTPTTGTPASALIPAATPDPSPYWPTDGWRTSTPEEQGMDPEMLAQMLDAIDAQRLNVHSVLVIRHGHIVTEAYFSSYGPDTRHVLFSCTKSFVSALVGIAIDEGYIDGVDHRVLDFFPDHTFTNLDPLKEAITLEDLLTMASGLDWREGDAFIMQMWRSPDWVQFVLNLPMVEAPGSRFNYCSGCSHVLSAIIQETTGMKTWDFARTRLFEPLGISNLSWDSDPNGISIGGWGLMMTPRDMAKLGYLYLHNGVWDGKQIVPADWVKASVGKHIETGDVLDYGYQWWVYPALNAYTARGRAAQLISVLPAQDVVVVFTAELNNDEALLGLIQDFVAPAVRSSE